MKRRVSFPIWIATFFLTATLCAQTAPASATTASATSEDSKPTPTVDTASAPDIQTLIRKASDNDQLNDKKARDYTYIHRDVFHELDGKGQAKKDEINTYEVVVLYGDTTERLIAKDDKPLNEKDSKKEEEKIQKFIDKRKNESDSDRAKRQAKEAKDREEDRKFDNEIADAYVLTLQSAEDVNGRPAWVIHGEPRPGYQPKIKDAKVLTHFRWTAWIDKQDVQMARLDAEAIDTVSWGLFLARLHKGSHFHIEQVRVNDEVWLPEDINVKFDARFLLVKGFSGEFASAYSGYKRFRTESKITLASGPPPQ